MNIFNKCRHCSSFGTSTYHFDEKLIKVIDFLSTPFKILLYIFPKPSKFSNKLDNLFIRFLLFFLPKVGILRFKSIKGKYRKKIRNRSLVFIDYAKKQGFKIKSLSLFNNPTSFFSLKKNNKIFYFADLPLTLSSSPEINFDDKKNFKKLLSKNNFPTPKGKSFKNKKRALKFISNLGFPIVVKPQNSSLGKHVAVNIQSELEFEKCFDIAKQIDRNVIVEEYVKGKLFRVTMVGHKIVGACYKEPPNVVGDGKNSIKNLIAQKNKKEERAPKNQKNATLHELPINTEVKKFLSDQGISLSYVPNKGEKIYLHWKEALSFGADIHDVSEQLHSKNINLLKLLSKKLNTEIVGVDIIANDISKSWKDTTFKILEANSLPYIDMHHFPSSGDSRNVAKSILNRTKKYFESSESTLI